MGSVKLVQPTLERLPAYVAALERGWSPDTTHDVSTRQLAAIREDAAAFLDSLNPTVGGKVTLADGTKVARIPGPVLWIWDGTFCGTVNLRYVPGSEALPPHIQGHVGYAVVPWKQGRGYARQALRLLRPMAAGLGLPRLLVSCDEDNLASRRVIEVNGGVASGGRAHPDDAHKRKLLFWIDTAA